MSRKIYDVVVDKISLLWGENSPAVPHAERKFTILKRKKSVVSDAQKKRLSEIAKQFSTNDLTTETKKQ